MKISLAVLLALTLTSCINVPDNVKMPVAQALLVSEAGVDGINRSAVVAAPLLSAQIKAQVKGCVDTANNAVGAAYTLNKSGDVAGTVAQVNIALKNVADCQAATHPTNPAPVQP